MRRGLALLIVVAFLAACGSGRPTDQSSNAPGPLPPEASTSPAPTASDSASGPSSATPTSTAPASATPKPTLLQTTSDAHSQPWKDKNADFGWVSNATVVKGGVTFEFDRAEWLLPSEVKAWNKANPTHKVTVEDDYAIGNVSKRERTFFMRTGAVIFGSIILSGDVAPARITAAQFAARVDSAPDDGVTCWIYHKYGGLTGDVVQLEEQYRP
jgi:hypothetical protein